MCEANAGMIDSRRLENSRGFTKFGVQVLPLGRLGFGVETVSAVVPLYGACRSIIVGEGLGPFTGSRVKFAKHD